MSSEQELFPCGWAKQWLERAHPGLHWETIVICYAVSIVVLLVSVKALINVRHCRRDLESNPSDRAAIIAEHEKHVRKANRRQFYLANIYLLHILGIWLVDAGIGIYYVYQDTAENPDDYSTAVWLDLAVHMVGMLAIFLAVFILFPLAQILLVASIVEKYHRKSRTAGETYAAYIPAARTLTTHLLYIWSILGFFVMAWWEPFLYATARFLILEAIMGSCIAWYHASFVLNFRADSLAFLAESEVQPLSGLKDGVKLYGTQVYAIHSGKGSDVLPQYNAVSQTDEKTDL